ncbi:hypothetical protein COS91_01335 [Candidatus Desantisbacteria bacterium CG07_land_8_20_14_0_80_39_15]|uniref:Uncharacterized protein n=2 Tax=unclassified Candidatus Desantisiibacteriota TaxID=3106372 RepID=A0A2H9PCZ3_9BACT|nr:MAG: hypothetical protein COS91_01335 [Candidatus Desantisbacteria bacterium CG07_land_8_20_14_0_80_39_15]PIZ17278.1 MAG: hypothetical protein COY51_00630 [Candidatus Desantisbacteria bacterium CG_4_10_14_0_8_um_filter_39_17]
MLNTEIPQNESWVPGPQDLTPASGNSRVPFANLFFHPREPLFLWVLLHRSILEPLGLWGQARNEYVDE